MSFPVRHYLSFYETKYTLAAKLKNGSPSALLSVQKILNVNAMTRKGRILIELTSPDRKKNAFKQEWETEAEPKGYLKHQIMCPRYSIYPSVNDQPRKLLMESLLIDNPKIAEKQTDTYNELYGSLISETQISNKEYPRIENYNCSKNCGFLNKEEYSDLINIDNIISKMGRPYRIDDVFYFPGKHLINSICTDKFIYLYYLARGGDNLYTRISKRTKDRFNEEWCVAIQMYKIGEKIKTLSPHILSIEEQNSDIILSIFDDETNKLFKVIGKSKHKK